MIELIEQSFLGLRNFCEKENFKGWDIFDGLNSRIFQSIPYIKDSRLMRLAWIQFFKRSPINLRKITLIQKDFNPKGLGLFLSGYCRLYHIDQNEDHLSKIKFLSETLISLQSIGWSGSCWGYNFDWQARAFFQPKYTPTIVAPTFIGNALLDAYEILKDERLLSISCSISDFILNDLNKSYDSSGNYAFSYSPGDNTQVFNASLLGSRMLSRIYLYTKEEELIREARKSVEFCCQHQNEDGSWYYGTAPYQNWIDSFHTGYNLECLGEYQKYSGDQSYQENISVGLNYYLNTFFTKKGKPKYYHNSIFPIDPHSTAQFVITLSNLHLFNEHHALIDKVLLWTINNLQDKAGYFYYHKNKFYTNKIKYMRWAQAWMFLALSTYLFETKSQIIQ